MEGKKAVLFDCWNTLFRTREENLTTVLAEFIGEEDVSYNFIKRIEEIFMLKTYAKLEDPIKTFLASRKVDFTEKDVENLKNNLKKIYSSASYFPKAEEILKHLKNEDFKLVLISNTFKHAHNYLEEKFGISKIFDATIASHEVGLLKPEPEIFEMALDKVEVSKKSAIMVGDNLRDDVLASKRAGIDSILLDRKGEDPNYEPKIESLTELKKYLRT